MSTKTTRRFFLRASATVAVAQGCAHDKDGRRTEASGSTDVAVPDAAASAKVTTMINGREYAADVDPDDTALELVRDRLSITGSKLGCGHGACGACTMNVDGQPVATCLLPATSLHRAKVTTVEGIGSNGKLHPMQRAFMANDALQCGYCTPGFVVEAAAFYDRWRAEQPDATPSRDDVAAALSGHLCRCGAYEGIYEAVRQACAGKFERGGGASPRYDAKAKVTGSAEYTVDVRLSGMLWARALCSPYAHAKVTKLDWTKALDLPGVRGAVEVLGANRLIRYAGQEILAIAAVDEATARKAIEAVEIEYEVLEALIDPARAREPSAPQIFPARKERKHPVSAAEGPVIPAKWSGNRRGPFRLFSKKKGAARRAVARARKGDGALSEGTFSTAVQCHSCLEPHAAVASWDSATALTVYISTQAVSHLKHELAEHFDLDEDDVRVIAKYIGGGFGSKATLSTETKIAVELARVCKAPVRYALDRREDIMIGGNRPGTSTNAALAIADDGGFSGFTAEIESYSGIAVGHAVGPMMRILYPKQPKQLDDWEVVTHSPPGKPLRGPGGPQAYWSMEQLIDDAAHQRGEDPLAVRRRWDPNPARQPLYAWADGLDAWKNRPPHQSDKGRFRRGIGVACAGWFAFAEPTSRVQIDTSRKGVAVSCGAQDMGNGTRTVLADVVARELGLQRKHIDVRVGDSRYVHGPMSAGSRTTSSLVPAILDACEQLKKELADVYETRFSAKAKSVNAEGVAASEGGARTGWLELMQQGPAVSVIGRRTRDKGGFFLPPLMGLGIERYITAAIQIAEVEVDTRLGRVRPTRMWAGFGVGNIVSPTLARSQATGGILQAISYALYEERRLDPKHGFLLSAGLEDYRIMGISDAPPIEVFFAEDGYDRVRGRSVGLAEIVTLAPPAALGNAVFNATGWRPKQLPMRPDRVLKGLEA